MSAEAGSKRPTGPRAALFTAPAAGASTPPPVRHLTSVDDRHALFSAPPRETGALVVECQRCEARTPLSLVAVARALLPSVWVPGRAFPRYMRCPADGHAAWCRVHWRMLVSR
jgi:hypothetical protein